MKQFNIDESTLRQLIKEVIAQVLNEYKGELVDKLGSKNAVVPRTQSAQVSSPLTESKISALYKQGITEMELPPQCVVTPLAKAKARQLNITLNYNNRSTP